MKALTSILLAIAFASALDATALKPAALQYEGRVYNVHGPTLSPEMWAAYVKYTEEKKIHPMVALYGGFDLGFSVRGDKLFLERITFTFDRTAKPQDVIGVEIPAEGLEAEWINGELIEYFGERVIDHVKSHERVFEFRDGIMVRQFTRENRHFKKHDKQRREEGEPGATDNPDDAQRLREDH